MKHDMVIGHYSSSGYVGTKADFLKNPTIKFEYDKEALKEKEENDPVNKPEHYQYSSIQPIDVIDAWELDFYLGSVIKYLSRYQRKGKPLEDLKKAAWYLNKKIEEMEKNV